MNFFTTTVFLFCSLQLFSQEHTTISLSEFIINDFDDRNFYFDQIVNNSNTDVIGYSKIDNKAKVSVLKFELGYQSEIEMLLVRSFPKKGYQIGLKLIVEELSVTEKTKLSKSGVSVIFHAQINLGDTILYSTKIEKKFEGDFYTSDYPQLITTTIKEFIYDFAMVPDQPLLKQETKPVAIENTYEVGSRNVTAVGYQIGGFSLIGINYEFRASDNIGIHAGVGYRGFTAGVKIHWRPTKDGGFINISYKDGGFGEIIGWAVEYGSRRAFRKSKGAFGFHYQVGLVLITDLSPEFRRAFGGVEPPFPSISLGLGFSW
ncbi:MAG: hypothetical protein L3J06_08375 [Cyclobacteriaceae bacterium]|nr:hypothetical protein [Cyclobacteriaceae bacterium]